MKRKSVAVIISVMVTIGVGNIGFATNPNMDNIDKLMREYQTLVHESGGGTNPINNGEITNIKETLRDKIYDIEDKETRDELFAKMGRIGEDEAGVEVIGVGKEEIESEVVNIGGRDFDQEDLRIKLIWAAGLVSMAASLLTLMMGAVHVSYILNMVGGSILILFGEDLVPAIVISVIVVATTVAIDATNKRTRYW